MVEFDRAKLGPCTQCGRCCTNASFMGGMEATGEDVLRWEAEGREDILSWAMVLGPPDNPWADLWVNGEKEAQRCPFVRKVPGVNRYHCRIYETRPQVCRDYPGNFEHMQAVNCEMLPTDS